MYLKEHNPPHFHVEYNEFRAMFNIESLVIMEGELPSRVLNLVVEWASIHQKELSQNWNSLRQKGSFDKIKPLV